MCGLLGEFIFKSKLLPKDNFISLLNRSRKRGPDSQDYYTNEKNIQFGFNRLAILDLSENANQPIHSPSGNFTMVFNGEIYNHMELRYGLPNDKYVFKGNGDTESLIACFDHYGVEKTVNKLDGMFAIGLFDHQDLTLHLIRDFAGIKPLHYGIDSGGVVFASQYDQILHHPRCKKNSIDPEILHIYLEQHFIPSPFGILKNTFQVMPGEIVSFNHNGNKRRTRYWELPDWIESDIHTDKVALERIALDLEKSVNDELVSDVPVGAFLSGGIDSPLICFDAQNALNGGLETFSIGSDSNIHDESIDAREYAEKLSVKHHLEIMKSKNAADMLDDAMSSLSEPFADYSIIATYQICRNAKRKVTVSLSGDGGDELFFGYERFWSIIKNRYIQRFPYPIKYFIYGTDKILTGNKWINSGVLALSSGESHRYSQSRFSKRWMSAIIPEITNTKSPLEWNTYLFPHDTSIRRLASSIRKAEFYGMMQKTLFKVDRASMANSLEVRVPFLKKTMIETALSIDPLLSLKDKKRKRLLYKLIRYRYPEKKISTVKRGFSIPLTKWIREELREPIADILLSEKHSEDFNFNRSMINKMLNDHLSKKADYHWPLFTIYSLFKWNENTEK